MKNLKIAISGEVGTGKSVLASVLQEKLTEIGYNVILLPTDDKSPKKVGDYIDTLAKETNVVVEEITTKRLPIEKNDGFFDIKDAFYVTKDEITPVKAFELKESTYNGHNMIIYVSSKNGWAKKQIHTGVLFYFSEIAWTMDEAIALQKAKLDEHLKSLLSQQTKNIEEITTIKNKLNIN